MFLSNIRHLRKVIIAVALLVNGCTDDSIETSDIVILKITDKTDVSFTIEAIVTENGNDIISKGFVWGLEIDPTLEDNSIASGSGSGEFSETITNLEPVTEYYVRAYVTDASGTYYSRYSTITTVGGIANHVNLESQEEINEFGSNYYSELTGSLIISVTDAERPLDLSPLSSIQKVNRLSILRNNNLINLTQLNIKSVSEGIRIENNESLNNLEGLENIKQIDGFLEIRYNTFLTSLEGLSDSLKVGGQLDLSRNPDITNLDGLSGLYSVGNLYISANDTLSDFCGISHLFVDENLPVYEIWGNQYNPSLQALRDGNCSQ